jgi:hypothetical protein
MHRTKKKMSTLPTYYEKVVLDSLLQMNYGVCLAQRIAGGYHQAKGMKEVYDLPHKGKLSRELKFPPCVLVEEH